MPIQLREEDGGKLLNVHFSSKLTSADDAHPKSAGDWLSEV